MEDLFKTAEKVVVTAKAKGLKIALAESCTGGMAATAITSVAGSSEVFDRGFVTYSYEAKTELLNVSRDLLQKHGAVSGECVEQMAMGAINNSVADIAISISGIAGPTGGMKDKPVGLVYFGSYDRKKNKVTSEKQQFSGDRNAVRVNSTKRALEILLEMMS